MNRKYYLDNLKIFLIILVIFHHAGQAYGDGGGWAYTPSNSAEYMPWIWHFFAVNAGFFMGLFFLISGYFVPSSYDRQGCKIFIKKKLIHLGIPLLILGILLSAITGRFEVAHMWYVESLLVFCLIYVLIRRFVKPIASNSNLRLTISKLSIIGLIMGIGSYFIRQISPQDHWIWPFGIIPLPMEPAHYLQYVMMFVLGILSNRFNWIENIKDNTGCVCLLIGCFLSIGIYILNGGWWHGFVNDWYGIYESLLCVFLSFGILWIFHQFFNGTSTFLQWCSAQTYGAYIVHLLIMLAIQYTFDALWLGAIGKFIFIGLSTALVSFLLTWALRCIPGVKKII